MSSDIRKVFVNETLTSVPPYFDVEPEFFVLSSKNSVTHYKQYPYPRLMIPDVELSEDEMDNVLAFLIREIIELKWNNKITELGTNEIEEKANSILQKIDKTFCVHNILTGSKHKIKTKKAKILRDKNIDSDLAICFVEPECVGYISKVRENFSIFVCAPQYIVPIRIKP